MERPAAGADKAHFVTTVNKWPTEPGPRRSRSRRPGRRRRPVDRPLPGERRRRHHEPGRRATSCATRSTRARYGEVDRDNPGTIQFPQNVGRALRRRQDRGCRRSGSTLGQPYMPPFPVTLTGHSSSEGDEALNMRLSEDRARAVSNEIVSGRRAAPADGRPAGRGGRGRRRPSGGGSTSPSATSRPTRRRSRTSSATCSGSATSTRRATAAPATSAPPVAHSALAEKLIPGQQPILAHHSEDIMSNGEVVRPHHYVTFLEVLGDDDRHRGHLGHPARASARRATSPAPAPDG